MANRSGLDEADSGAGDHRVTTEEDALVSRRRQAAASCWLHASKAPSTPGTYRRAQDPRSSQPKRCFSPFDPIVWERDCASDLFNFHYRIEI